MGINSAQVVEVLSAASEPTPGGCAGMAFQAVDRTGAILASGVSGYRDITTQDPITLDTVFWIASCSKLSTSIAVMQLVEAGKVSLDDADILAKTCPELASAKVLKDGKETEQLSEAEGGKRITLRMLLTHTSGLSYSFLWEEYWKTIEGDANRDEFSGKESAFVQPLKFQPGTDREYAVGIDWVGIFVSRFTGMKLGEYMEKNMFGPIGMDSTAFEPTPDMRGRMTKMHTRDGSGKVVPRKHPLPVMEGETPENWFHSGGGGLLSTVQDYTKLLATIVNDGVSPYTGKLILKKDTIDQMFTNQIPQFRELYGTRGMDISRFDLASPLFSQPQPDIGPQGWGLSFQVLGEPEGEQYSMASAPGICNCFWVMERKSGRAGMLLSQMLPLGDMSVMGTWMGLVGKIFEP